jgi:phosphohistidine phosphatase
MARQLLVLRHAKSSWADEGLDDWQRPLNARGERDAPRVGELIRRHALLPDLIVSSDAVRAETTARAVAGAAGYQGTLQLSPDLYHATPNALIEVIRKVGDDARRLMIVGHNPGLEDLVAELTGERVELPTAALVHISMPVEQWRDVEATRGATLVDIWRPRDR